MTIEQQALHIQCLVLDVDGILTDGQVTYTSHGEELKSFNIKDGLGIKLLQSAQVDIAIITGRVSPMVARRANELGIEHVIQGREDKLSALKELCNSLSIPLSAVAYMGDDLPDYNAINAAGLGMTVADAHADVISIADWTSQKNGGKGAVREACDFLLQAKGAYQTAVSPFIDGQH